MQIAAISWISWILNGAFDACRRVRRTSADVYNVMTVDSCWYINKVGQFVDSSIFSLNNMPLWIYENDTLKFGLVAGRPKKFPLLSCEMKYDDNIISLDSFLEDTKIISEVTPSLPVLMAAFQIHQKKVIPWWSAKFTGYTRLGNEITFDGSVVDIPSE